MLTLAFSIALFVSLSNTKITKIFFGCMLQKEVVVVAVDDVCVVVIVVGVVVVGVVVVGVDVVGVDVVGVIVVGVVEVGIVVSAVDVVLMVVVDVLGCSSRIKITSGSHAAQSFGSQFKTFLKILLNIPSAETSIM